MANLVLVRHGKSLWNLENRFTGWVDVGLSSDGENEAGKAALLLKDYKFDRLFTSNLTRAINTASIITGQLGMEDICTERSDALNERHYGDLQGLNKDDVGRRYGTEQLHTWRRSYDTAPPNGESLADTRKRVVSYYQEFIEPHLINGESILIVAHGNSLRSLVMHLEDLSREQVLSLDIPTGTPYLYVFDNDMKILEHKYLG